MVTKLGDTPNTNCRSNQTTDLAGDGADRHDTSIRMHRDHRKMCYFMFFFVPQSLIQNKLGFYRINLQFNFNLINLRCLSYIQHVQLHTFEKAATIGETMSFPVSLAPASCRVRSLAHRCYSVDAPGDQQLGLPFSFFDFWISLLRSSCRSFWINLIYR